MCKYTVCEQEKKRIFDVINFFKTVVILQDNVTRVCVCVCVCVCPCAHARARVFVCVFMTVCPSPVQLLNPWKFSMHVVPTQASRNSKCLISYISKWHMADGRAYEAGATLVPLNLSCRNNVCFCQVHNRVRVH